MYNNQRGVTTKEQNCKVKTVVEVNSEKYEADKAYSQSIDNTLNKLFSKDINTSR